MTFPRGLYSRPDKLNHAQTVLYEIDMLRFAKERLSFPQTASVKPDEWVYLEAFLLHYRNLIEFFGKRKLDVKPDALSISRPEDIWPGRVPDKAVVARMASLDLWEKYDTHDNDKAISKYLHHCTTQRTEGAKWHVNTMYEELRPVLEQFEALLPEYKPATHTRTFSNVAAPLPDGHSTASTRVIDLGLNPSFPVKKA